MNFPKLRLSTPVAILVILFAVLLGPLFFYFGLMNLIHPDVPAAYLTQNTVVCLALIAAAPGLLFLAVAAYLGSLRKPWPSSASKHSAPIRSDRPASRSQK